MADKEAKPLKTAVETFNEGVNTIANAAYSLPDAVARGVSSALHGEEAVKKVVGEFDARPIDTVRARINNDPGRTR